MMFFSILELTFQLTMYGIDNSETSKDGKWILQALVTIPINFYLQSIFTIAHHILCIILEYERTIVELKAHLKENERKHVDLQKELMKQNQLTKELKSQLKINEKKYLEELKSKNSQVLALKIELDSKSGAIANLTTEIHKLKVSHASMDQLSSPVLRSPSSREGSSKRKSRQLSADLQSRPVTGKCSALAPDAGLFLARASPVEPASEVSAKPTPPVLPPISNDIKALNRRQRLIRRRLDITPQPEYTSLAVEQLASSSNTYIHEPNTTK